MILFELRTPLHIYKEKMFFLSSQRFAGCSKLYRNVSTTENSLTLILQIDLFVILLNIESNK